MLLTRAADDNAAAARHFEERGATVTWIPLIRIGPAPDPAALRDAAQLADEFEWIAFSSSHGVEAFARARHAVLANPPAIAVIGPATAQAVATILGRPADLVPTTYMAEDLAEAIAQIARPGSKVLLVQAGDARPILASRLQAAALDVTSVVAYTTLEEPPPDLDQYVRGNDVIVLASGSAARSFARGLTRSREAISTRGKLIACIGAVTEHEARQAGLQVEIVPDRPTFEDLAVALAAYYGQAQSNDTH